MACPICEKPTNPDFRPFCSARCADVDLAKWLNGAYVIPGRSAEEEDTSPPEASDDRLH